VEIQQSLESMFPAVTFFGVEDVAGTTQVATNLDPVHSNASLAQAICESPVAIGADKALVQGQGAYSMWTCTSSGFSQEGSGYTD
jgi:uncharacterized protein YfaQ (DUF2300 family)